MVFHVVSAPAEVPPGVSTAQVDDAVIARRVIPETLPDRVYALRVDGVVFARPSVIRAVSRNRPKK